MYAIRWEIEMNPSNINSSRSFFGYSRCVFYENIPVTKCVNILKSIKKLLLSIILPQNCGLWTISNPGTHSHEHQNATVEELRGMSTKILQYTYFDDIMSVPPLCIWGECVRVYVFVWYEWRRRRRRGRTVFKEKEEKTPKKRFTILEVNLYNSIKPTFDSLVMRCAYHGQDRWGRTTQQLNSLLRLRISHRFIFIQTIYLYINSYSYSEIPERIPTTPHIHRLYHNTHSIAHRNVSQRILVEVFHSSEVAKPLNFDSLARCSLFFHFIFPLHIIRLEFVELLFFFFLWVTNDEPTVCWGELLKRIHFSISFCIIIVPFSSSRRHNTISVVAVLSHSSIVCSSISIRRNSSINKYLVEFSVSKSTKHIFWSLPEKLMIENFVFLIHNISERTVEFNFGNIYIRANFCELFRCSFFYAAVKFVFK